MPPVQDLEMRLKLLPLHGERWVARICASLALTFDLAFMRLVQHTLLEGQRSCSNQPLLEGCNCSHSGLTSHSCSDNCCSW